MKKILYNFTVSNFWEINSLMAEMASSDKKISLGKNKIY